MDDVVEKDATWFIETVLIGEIGEINKHHHYLSFLLIAAGIEFLGACLSEEPFNQEKLSRERFEKAIEELFPSKYTPSKDLLFTSLRCGLAHMVRPKNGLGLMQRKKMKSLAQGTSQKRTEI